MKRLFYLPLMLVLALLSCSQWQRQPVTVGYITLEREPTPEDQAIFQWLGKEKDLFVQQVNLPVDWEEINNLDVLWIHVPDSSSLPDWKGYRDLFPLLRQYYQSGGSLLFTDFAAFFPSWMEVETTPPTIRDLNIKDDWNFDKQGFHSFRGHPIFDGMYGGAYVLDLYQDARIPIVGYFQQDYPTEGKVVGVRRSYITIHETEKLITEYRQDKGRILSIGGFIYFARKNHRALHLRRLIANAFRYLAGRLDRLPRSYWVKSDLKPRPFKPGPLPVNPKGQRLLSDLPSCGLLLEREEATANFFDVAGRRALIMGKEKGGLDEVWIHPIRILRDFKVAVVRQDTLYWLHEIPARIEVRPESFTRFYDLGEGILKEMIFPSLERGGGVIHYQWDSDQPIELLLQGRCDLRWMWPYNYDALGAIFYGADSANGVFHVRDRSGDFYALFGTDVKPRQWLLGPYEAVRWSPQRLQGLPTNLNQAYFAALYSLDSTDNFILNFAFVGSNEGEKVAREDFRQLLEHPKDEYNKLSKHYYHLLANSVEFQTPDPEFNRLWRWALVGTDRFLVHTPGLGTALVAGYGTTERGWNGNQKISGRPGYAWYFGRDSEWAGLAIDAYGDVGLVRRQLQFLQKYQDISGKIFHEVSTSGVVHFDAADATPLYIILAAHYLRASGDLDFLRESWPHLKKAMDFLYSTDTDRDGLIENTNVGHGGVEGGKLWGAHTTFYLAGLWARTLQDAAYLAGKLGKERLRLRYEQDARKVVQKINHDFWNPETRFFNYGLKADGTYMTEPTALPAVPMYFRVVDSSKVAHMLSEYADNGFSADWGVRILSRQSPLFNPRGYHYGSIWPLFTGWTASAEYAYNDPVPGFTHIMNNMLIKNHWALGFVEEVMNGAVYEPSGVCAHQCWSETNIILPAIEGMLGWQPDAPEHLARLAPQLPPQWDTLTVKNLLVGEARLEFRQYRQKGKVKYFFRKQGGEELEIHFLPQIFPGMEISRVVLNGIEVPPATDKAPLVFTLEDSATVKLEFQGGIAVVPEVPHPQPGDFSRGYRVVQANLEGKRFILRLSGKSGTRHVFRLRLFDRKIERVQHARLVPTGDKRLLGLEVFFPASRKMYTERQVTIHLD